jgi:hypothetical protein
MQNYELDQKIGKEINEQNSTPATESRWREANFFALAGPQVGVVIDNGGSEVSALND